MCRDGRQTPQTSNGCRSTSLLLYTMRFQPALTERPAGCRPSEGLHSARLAVAEAGCCYNHASSARIAAQRMLGQERLDWVRQGWCWPPIRPWVQYLAEEHNVNRPSTAVGAAVALLLFAAHRPVWAKEGQHGV